MTHLLSLKSNTPSEAREILTHNHAPTFNSPAHRRTNFWLDPLLDNYLNPAKGETLWFEKSKWVQIPGYKDPFKVLGDLEITLSPIAMLSECLKINAGLEEYNTEKLGPNAWKDTRLLQTPYVSSPVGATFQESFIFTPDKLLEKIGLARTMNFLAQTEMIALSKGVHRSYVNIENSKENMGPLFPVIPERVQLVQTLLEAGYSFTGEFHHLSENTYEQRLYKETAGPAFSLEALFEIPDCQWIKEPEDDLLLLPAKFGVFVRKNGHVKGGLFGDINIQKVFIPNSHIDIFWIDASVRKTGLGTKVMNFALEHSKQRGAEVAELGTMDYHAPGFYEKMGFLRIHTDPKIIRTKDGKLNNSYDYRKYL